MKFWENVIKYLEHAMLIVIAVAISAFLFTGAWNFFYSMVYKDMVKQTVIEMVKKEALNEQQ